MASIMGARLLPHEPNKFFRLKIICYIITSATVPTNMSMQAQAPDPTARVSSPLDRVEAWLKGMATLLNQPRLVNTDGGEDNNLERLSEAENLDKSVNKQGAIAPPSAPPSTPASIPSFQTALSRASEDSGETASTRDDLVYRSEIVGEADIVINRWPSDEIRQWLEDNMPEIDGDEHKRAPNHDQVGLENRRALIKETAGALARKATQLKENNIDDEASWKNLIQTAVEALTKDLLPLATVRDREWSPELEPRPLLGPFCETLRWLNERLQPRPKVAIRDLCPSITVGLSEHIFDRGRCRSFTSDDENNLDMDMPKARDLLHDFSWTTSFFDHDPADPDIPVRLYLPILDVEVRSYGAGGTLIGSENQTAVAGASMLATAESVWDLVPRVDPSKVCSPRLTSKTTHPGTTHSLGTGDRHARPEQKTRHQRRLAYDDHDPSVCFSVATETHVTGLYVHYIQYPEKSTQKETTANSSMCRPTPNNTTTTATDTKKIVTGNLGIFMATSPENMECFLRALNAIFEWAAFALRDRALRTLQAGLAADNVTTSAGEWAQHTNAAIDKTLKDSKDNIVAQRSHPCDFAERGRAGAWWKSAGAADESSVD
ncbi:MAG: hypothetical protein M1819_002494 [Sarea resinae]|nr:MAG: hypothetical protein M1819_002494 [Sarea resinae]